jgi:hypothetical protein
MAYTYSKLASTTVGATSVANITFSNIPQNYTDLVLKVSLRSTTDDNAGMTFNGSTTGYSFRRLFGNGTTAYSDSDTYAGFGVSSGPYYGSNTFNSADIYIPNYASSNPKTYSAETVQENNAAYGVQFMYAGLWNNPTAISSIKIAPLNPYNYVQYSTATLYGIRVEL